MHCIQGHDPDVARGVMKPSTLGGPLRRSLTTQATVGNTDPYTGGPVTGGGGGAGGGVCQSGRSCGRQVR